MIPPAAPESMMRYAKAPIFSWLCLEVVYLRHSTMKKPPSAESDALRVDFPTSAGAVTKYVLLALDVIEAKLMGELTEQVSRHFLVGFPALTHLDISSQLSKL